MNKILTIVLLLMAFFCTCQTVFASDPSSGEFYHCEDEFGSYESSFPCEDTPGIVCCDFCYERFSENMEHCPKEIWCILCKNYHHAEEECEKTENENEEEDNNHLGGGGNGTKTDEDDDRNVINEENNNSNNDEGTTTITIEPQNPTVLPSGEIRVMLPNYNNQSLLVKYENYENCMDVAKELMFKLNGDSIVGSVTNVLRTAFREGDSVIYDLNAALEALDIIIRHIDANRSIMVGIDYGFSTQEQNNFDKITDHFVPIVGYGKDSNGNWYLQFLESGSSLEENQFKEENRLTLDTDRGCWEWSPYEDIDYTYRVTHVRPNDGQ